MEVLEYKYGDEYAIKAATTDVRRSWQKFKVRVNEPLKYSKYEADKEGSLRLLDYTNYQIADVPIEEWDEQRPVFFETNAYNISIYFYHLKSGTKPYIIHPSKNVSEMFNFDGNGNYGSLTGQLSFLNEPGRFSLKFHYVSEDDTQHTGHLDFDVVTPKLDIKTDGKQIVKEIREEYNELLFRYLSLTFQQYAEGREANNDAIWLSVFRTIIDGYLNSVRYILNRTHNRDIRQTHWQRPDRIRRWTPALENKFANDRAKDAEKAFRKLYGVEQNDSTYDTRENRFVKFTVERIGERLNRIIRTIPENSDSKLSDEERNALYGYSRELNILRSASLFRTIGRFEGFKQESLVLQQRTGYSQIYRYWLLLQNGLDLIDGSTGVGILPIWKLYEVWCFLKMKKLVRDILGIDSTNPQHLKKYVKENTTTMFNPFTGSDVEDYVFYTNPANEQEIIELGYQYEYSKYQDKDDVRSMTVKQKPDIVMNIHRKDEEMVLTYLYDAKYRVEGDDDPEYDKVTDAPVPETLNQMHRYRDALYYGSRHSGNFSKEVIGGYILFPGRIDEQKCIELTKTRQFRMLPDFLQSIIDVNIGAFPLLPNEDDNRPEHGLLLKRHLERVIKRQPLVQIKDSIPQRGLTYSLAPEDKDSLVLIGYCKSGNRQTILNNKLYYVRAGLKAGSLHLMPGFEHSKYLLLHDRTTKEIYKLKETGPRFVSGDELRTLGFEASKDYYLCFELKDTVPIVEFVNEQGKILQLKQSSNPYAKEPYFTTMKELFSIDG